MSLSVKLMNTPQSFACPEGSTRAVAPAARANTSKHATKFTKHLPKGTTDTVAVTAGVLRACVQGAWDVLRVGPAERVGELRNKSQLTSMLPLESNNTSTSAAPKSEQGATVSGSLGITGGSVTAKVGVAVGFEVGATVGI